MAARWIGQTYGIPITHGAISLRVASSEHLRQVRRECEEDGLDFAEYKLLDLIKSGDRTAIIFYLKCKGKERGYIERKEFSGSLTGNFAPPNVVVNFVEPEEDGTDPSSD